MNKWAYKFTKSQTKHIMNPWTKQLISPQTDEQTNLQVHKLTNEQAYRVTNILQNTRCLSLHSSENYGFLASNLMQNPPSASPLPVYF